jgi:threonine dehydrogenase-like Zn-dependent dehydrogenase
MRAVVYRGVNDLRLETLPVPVIGRHELLVRVAVCGVCPTDIKKIHYGTVAPPRVFGHETAGTIVKAGAGVTGFKPGDRVALHHHVPCLDCHFCRHHAFAQCATYKRTGITAGFEPAGGGYAEYVRVMPFVLPGVVKIPRTSTFEEGAMLEPVNTVLKAIRRLALLPGDTVLVAGQGPIGLMFTRLLQLAGMKVLATDLLASRLQLAKKFGAKWVEKVEGGRKKEEGRRKKEETGGQKSEVRSQKSDSPFLPSSFFLLPSPLAPSPRGEGRGEGSPAPVITEGSAPVQALPPPTLHSSLFPLPSPLDAAVIAVPSDAAVRQALGWLRGGGQVMLFAHTKRGAATPLDLAEVCVDEKDLLGSYSADFTLQKEVARLVFRRELDVRRLITHRFPLDQTAAAVQLAAHPTADSLKILVTQAE